MSVGHHDEDTYGLKWILRKIKLKKKASLWETTIKYVVSHHYNGGRQKTTTFAVIVYKVFIKPNRYSLMLTLLHQLVSYCIFIKNIETHLDSIWYRQLIYLKKNRLLMNYNFSSGNWPKMFKLGDLVETNDKNTLGLWRISL